MTQPVATCQNHPAVDAVAITQEPDGSRGFFCEACSEDLFLDKDTKVMWCR